MIRRIFRAKCILYSLLLNTLPSALAWLFSLTLVFSHVSGNRKGVSEMAISDPTSPSSTHFSLHFAFSYKYQALFPITNEKQPRHHNTIQNGCYNPLHNILLPPQRSRHPPPCRRLQTPRQRISHHSKLRILRLRRLEPSTLHQRRKHQFLANQDEWDQGQGEGAGSTRWDSGEICGLALWQMWRRL